MGNPRLPARREEMEIGHGRRLAVAAEREPPMCLACEEQEYFFRLWCVDFLARGEMPPGVTTDDLLAMGLPLPKPADGGTAQESGVSGRQHAEPSAAAFSCDSPDE